jgi:hypothetical protein
MHMKLTQFFGLSQACPVVGMILLYYNNKVQTWESETSTPTELASQTIINNLQAAELSADLRISVIRVRVSVKKIHFRG